MPVYKIDGGKVIGVHITRLARRTEAVHERGIVVALSVNRFRHGEARGLGWRSAISDLASKLVGHGPVVAVQ